MPSNKSASRRDKSPEMPELEPLESKSSSKSAHDADKKKTTTDVDIRDLSQPSSRTKNRVNALKNNQLKYLEAQVKYYEELQVLQSKYAQIYSDIFERRRQIVSGECEPSPNECKWSSDDESAAQNQDEETKEAKEKEEEKRAENTTNKKIVKSNDEEDEDEDEKGVPNFWLEVLQSSRRFEHLICDHDEPILAYLIDIRVRVEPEKPANSYTLEFEFAENPYFKNRVLTKTFEFKNELDEWNKLSYRGPDLVRAIGCKIDWKPKKNVTIKLIKKKIKTRGNNRKSHPKIITKEENQPSFFRFFETHKCIANEDDEKMKAELKKREEKATKEKEMNSKQVATSASKNSEGSTSSDGGDDDDDDDDESYVPSETSAEINSKLKETFVMMYDFSIGERLRNKIIPKAVLYMTGEAQDTDREDNDDDDDDCDDYDDDDDDEDYENDEDGSDDSDDHTRRAHLAEWDRAMSERVFNNPMVRRAVNPGDCRPS